MQDIVKKILIVEDEKFMNTILQSNLAQAGFQLQMANNGEEAFEVMGNFVPDLILLDIIMPVVDGFTFLEQIKQNEKLQNIPVIVLTGLSQNEAKEKAMNLGALDFMIKTDFSLQDIIDRVKMVFKD